MANKVVTQVVIAAFHHEEAAAQVADALKEAKKQNQLSYRNVAVINKNNAGKVKVKETGDLSAAPGAGVGALVGGAFGLLAGPAGFAAGSAAGAVIGGTGAIIIDSGLDNQRLQQIGDVLQPGNSALIAVFEEMNVDKMTMKEVNRDLGEVLASLSADISDALHRGQDVAYLFAVTADGIVASRMAAGEKAGDIQGLVAVQEGFIVGQAVATEDGVAYEIAAATGDEAAYEVGVATDEGTAVVEAYAATE